jgi:hypothetical protein
MLKVHILTQCSHCKGQAYLPVGEAENHKGEKSTRYLPCPVCEGSGNEPKWVSLEEFAVLLRQAQCTHEHTAFKGGFHFSDGDVWDDLVEYCIDCQANLDKQATIS